jgi:hypothetical protein
MLKDFLNPDAPTSQARGWTKYRDNVKPDETIVRAWDGEWKNPDGDVLVFSLRYRHPADRPPDRSGARVLAIYIPSKVVERIRRQAEKF